MKKLILLLLLLAATVAYAADGDPVLEGKLATGNIATIGQLGAGAAPSYPVDVHMIATDLYGIRIDGATHDYTGAGIAMTIRANRDINVSTLADYAGFQNYLNIKHTSAQTGLINYAYANIERVDNDADIINNTADNDEYHEYGTYSWIDSKGTLYDTQSTGNIDVVLTGIQSFLETNSTNLGSEDGNFRLSDSGGSNPTNTLDVRGFKARMFHDPDILSGTWNIETTGFDATIISQPVVTGGTVSQVTSGVKINVDADTEGTSTAYGLFIESLGGADTNYAIYSASTEDSYLAGDMGIGNSALESWATSLSVLQVGGNSAFTCDTSQGAASTISILSNAYFDSNDSRWEYISTDEASRYHMTGGTHIFRVASSGTADTLINWTTAQTITAAGLTQFGTAAGAGQVNITPGSAIAGLYIDQDYAVNGITVDHEGATGLGINITAKRAASFTQDIVDGYGLYVQRDLGSSDDASALATFLNDNAANTMSTVSVDHNGTGGATGYGIHVDSENLAAPAVSIESIIPLKMSTEEGHGGYERRIYAATSGTLTGATDKIELDIPAGWVIVQCQLHVKTTVVDDGGDDTWSSELNDGAQEEVISAGSAAAQNTNVNHFAHSDAGYGGTLTDAETDIVLTPQGGNFSAGEIEAHCIARGFDAWDVE